MLLLIGYSLFIIITLIESTRTRINSVDGQFLVVPIDKPFLVDYAFQCPKQCLPNSCLHSSVNKENCTKLIREPCDCCTVCLRTEFQLCGGPLNIYGFCDEPFLCYQSNQTGICVKACRKIQCLWVEKSHRRFCECAHRRVPCDVELDWNADQHCDDRSPLKQHILRSTNVKQSIDCSKIICEHNSTELSQCPSDSHWTHQSKNLSSICCQSRAYCGCAACPKTICDENSIIQIYRRGDGLTPGLCCDQFKCITNSKQCHHDKKIYQENETWTIDHCTTCLCQGGRVDCTMIQCPTYKHCGYMYKPENECCPICGGCLNDRFLVQHMNSTWIESNGCMKCWCENGRSRCVAEGCIAPPCENPRQIANVCCPVCDIDDQIDSNDNDVLIPSISNHCPAPLCTLTYDEKLAKPFCSCSSPSDRRCPSFNCDKHCPYNYTIDPETQCPQCACNPCPPLICNKNCTYGLKPNEIGCPLCICESQSTSKKDLSLSPWPRQCQSGLLSYSNGEIWFDGCRQCLCYKGQILCALISCPTPQCVQPVFLPNRCCPSCPDSSLLPEPLPSSQVCYSSQYVTGEELEFDKCTKCICLDNMAFCTISICPPLSCSSPIYDSSLCCPICPPFTSEVVVVDPTSDIKDEDVCLLDNGMIKHAGEVWKQNECQSCLCPRASQGQIECFSQRCPQQLPCQNPVLKKGQCCPFCLPSTATIAVCIFNYVQYRSGEHWNVSECHHCKCILGIIVCHQHKCPSLTCVYTVTLPGHCCPTCRDQFPLIPHRNPLAINPSGIGFSIIILFSILICILLLIILILLICLLRGRHRTISATHPYQTSSMLSHHPSITNSKSSNLYPYRYDLMLLAKEMHHTQTMLSSSSHLPLTSIEQISTHSMVDTNTTETISSSNQELATIHWQDDETLMLQCSTSSQDDDEMISDDQRDRPSPIQMIPGISTIIYV